MESDGIIVRGACEHNLKSISVKIPRGKMTVVTGLSGSGKSSLAFDTIYAEGQRRYIESLSSYAKQFLEQLKKPEVESISGLSPSIAIDQKSISSNPRSTVGTVTEIYDFVRLLFAKAGTPFCPNHNIPVSSRLPADIAAEILSRPAGSKFSILAPIAQDEKGEYLAEFKKAAQKGFLKAKVNGQWIDLAKASKLAKHKKHQIDILIDRLIVDEKYQSRLKESLNVALSEARGFVRIEWLTGETELFSIRNACAKCGFTFPEIEPRLFSFNNPRGACATCLGLGEIGNVETDFVEEEEEAEDEQTPVVFKVCPSCHGDRLKPEALSVFVDEKNIAQLSKMSVSDLSKFLRAARFQSREAIIAENILKQILLRLSYLERVGCNYLSLERPVRTLSGGEAQRIRLASQVGSALVGVLYVLDEPSIGLHPRDHHRLLELLNEIRDRGNTILLVEHDEDTIRGADYVIDIGPRAGRLGGELMAEGTPEDIANNPKSLTGQFLSGKFRVEVPKIRRRGNGNFVRIKNASGNNLKKVDLEIPIGTLCAITGVSGSGKSTLIVDTLYRALGNHFHKTSWPVQPFEKIEGLENLDRVIQINQRPIGRTPRSTPATYVGLFPLVRNLYSELPEAKIRGYKPGQFSFNVKGGRCPTCEGAGDVRVEMHFLADVYVQCYTCQGSRYTREILNVRFKDKNIAEILKMTVEEALEFFKHHSVIHRKLETLHKVGLDYMHLGQSSTTLSGGEAQRVKLSRELSKRSTGKTMYILDEPTTGLHFEDVRKLVELLQELVIQGNTVVVIEHNMDVIKSCDFVVDMGPEGGNQGGEIVAQGVPEAIASVSKSHTGRFLKSVLG